MREVAEAGGWEEHHIMNLEKELALLLKEKEVQKAISELTKIEKDEWVLMGSIMGDLKQIASSGLGQLTNVGVAGDLTESIKDTLKTELNNAIAPLKNELMNVINQLLAPFMPLIGAAVGEISTLIQRGVGAIQALIEGRFDEWFRQEQIALQETGAPQGIQTWLTESQAEQTLSYYESMYHQGHPEMIPAWAVDILNQYGSFAAYEAAASAAGIYSGQFDVDPSVIEAILSNLNLPNFDEEED